MGKLAWDQFKRNRSKKERQFLRDLQQRGTGKWNVSRRGHIYPYADGIGLTEMEI